MLLGEGLFAGYGKRQVLFDVSVEVRPREIVAVFGHNGAGKTTLLKVLFGMVRSRQGRVVFAGTDVTRQGTVDSVKSGMSLTLAERPVFRELTVRENLELGGFALRRNEAERRGRATSILEMFPILAERSGQRAGTLSGGQQRMLALGMALMAEPKVMLLDEPSLGLAPVLVQEFLRNVRKLVDENGTSVLLVEQNVGSALRVADRAYFLRAGRIILEETAEQALARGRSVGFLLGDRDGEQLSPWLGCWCRVESPFAIDAVAASGFDWLCLDLQHGLAGYSDVVALAQRLAVTATEFYIRVPWNDPSAIMKSLDAGVHGVIVPMVENASEVERAVSAVRYPPLGTRSSAGLGRGGADPKLATRPSSAE